MVGAVTEDLQNGVVIAGQQHRVRRILDAAVFAAQHVGSGLAAGAQQPVPVGGAEVFGADDLGETVLVGLRQGARAQLHLIGLQLGLIRIFKAHNLLQQAADSIGERLGRGGIPPRVPFHWRKEFLEVRHALQYYTWCQ